MKYLQTYNESLRDKMTPKSDEEVINAIDSFIKSTEERMDNGEDFIYDDALEIVEYVKQIKKISTIELVHLLIDEMDATPEEKLDWVFGIPEDTYGDETFGANAILMLLNIMKKK